MRPTFGREYIENERRRIADGLSAPLTVSMIEGGALSQRDPEGATKDMDLSLADGLAHDSTCWSATSFDSWSVRA
jgi:hypothetical protein